jgi:molecular chaperone GrpE (heat shock protein)
MENTTEKDLTNNNDAENTVTAENELQNEQHNSADSAENSHEGSKNGNSENPEELLKQELALANDKYIRLYSEFDNFRRRTAKEKIDLMFRFIQYVERQIVLFDAIEDAAFPVVNNLEGRGSLRDIKEKSEAKDKHEELCQLCINLDKFIIYIYFFLF